MQFFRKLEWPLLYTHSTDWLPRLPFAMFNPALFGKELRILRTSSEEFSELGPVVALVRGKEALPVGVGELSS